MLGKYDAGPVTLLPSAGGVGAITRCSVMAPGYAGGTAATRGRALNRRSALVRIDLPGNLRSGAFLRARSPGAGGCCGIRAPRIVEAMPTPSAPPAVFSAPPWREPGMPPLLAMTFFAFAGFALLMPVAPMHVVALGGDELQAGLANAVLMAVTILTQLNVERMRPKLGWPLTLVAGCLLLGAPSLVQITATEVWQVIALAGVRGIGFGIITVCGSSAIATLFSPGRRGRAIGIWGLSIALPQLIFTSTAAAIVEVGGFTVALAVGALPLIGVPFAVAVGRQITAHARAQADERRRARAEARSDAAASAAGVTAQPPGGTDAEASVADSPDETTAPGADATIPVADTASTPAAEPPTTTGGLAVTRPEVRAALVRMLPAVVSLTIVTCVGGAISSFTPQFTSGATLTFVALLAFTGLGAFARWAVGGPADRFGARRFILPGLGLAMLGAAAIAGGLAASDSALGTALVLLGVSLAGLSFGTMQNVTLVRAFELAGERASATASTTWNVAFDAGTGAGALLIGALAAGTSFMVAFAVLAAACLLVAVAVSVRTAR